MLIRGSKATGASGTGSSSPTNVGVPGSTSGGMSSCARADGMPTPSEKIRPATRAGANRWRVGTGFTITSVGGGLSPLQRARHEPPHEVPLQEQEQDKTRNSHH